MSVFKFKKYTEKDCVSKKLDTQCPYFFRHYSIGEKMDYLDDVLLNLLRELRHNFAYHLENRGLDNDFKMVLAKTKHAYNFFTWIIKFRQGGVVAIRKKSEYFELRKEIFAQYYYLKSKCAYKYETKSYWSKNRHKTKIKSFILATDSVNRVVKYFDKEEKEEFYVGRTDLKSTNISLIRKVELNINCPDKSILHPYLVKYSEMYIEFTTCRYFNNSDFKNISSPIKIIDYITNPYHYYGYEFTLSEWHNFFFLCFENMNKTDSRIAVGNAIRIMRHSNIFKNLK